MPHYGRPGRHRVLRRGDQILSRRSIAGPQLQQVLLNLITNAIEAMAAKDGLRTLGVRSEVSENGGVAVSIADTGRGIKPQEIEQIFNPLFTTKPDGMGMGLFICRSIVESHGGNLLVYLNSPQGVVFQMVLHASTTTSPATV